MHIELPACFRRTTHGRIAVTTLDRYGQSAGKLPGFNPEKEPIAPQRPHASSHSIRLIQMSRAYLLGALHDATEREYTYRLSQNDSQYVETVVSIVASLGFDAWTYQEGENRDMYVVEFAKTVLDGFEVASAEEKRAYARGYFDADGSVPKDPSARFYVYFAQSDKADLRELKTYLGELGIETGTLHQPSADNAPEYWRFYVSANSHKAFAEKVGSLHPRKRQMLREMRRSMP